MRLSVCIAAHTWIEHTLYVYMRACVREKKTPNITFDTKKGEQEFYSNFIHKLEAFN